MFKKITKIKIILIIIFVLIILTSIYGKYFFSQKSQLKDIRFIISIGNETSQLNFGDEKEKLFFTNDNNFFYIYNPYLDSINSYDFKGNFNKSVALNLSSDQTVVGLGMLDNKLILNVLKSNLKNLDEIDLEWCVIENDDVLTLLNTDIFSLGLNPLFNSINIQNGNYFIDVENSFYSINIDGNKLKKQPISGKFNPFGLDITQKQILRTDSKYIFKIRSIDKSFNHELKIDNIPTCDEIISIKSNELYCLTVSNKSLQKINFPEVKIYKINTDSKFEIIKENILDLYIDNKTLFVLSFDGKNIEVSNLKL